MNRPEKAVDEEIYDISETDDQRGIKAPEDAEISVSEGGSGSGNFGHEGRPGEVGGSGSGGGPASAHSDHLVSLLAQLREHGGFTYQPLTDNEPTEGLAVSIYEGRSVAIPINDIAHTDVEAYIRKNKDLLLKNPACHLGGWVSDGMACLDVAIVLPQENHEEAVRLGRAHDQKAYFDLKNKKEIVIDERATSGGALKGTEHGAGKRDSGNEEARAGPLERPEHHG